MFRRMIFAGFLILLFMPFAKAQPANWQLTDFAIDLNKLTTPPAQLWVSSGYATVTPVPGCVLGTADVMSPPISGRNMALSVVFVANGDTIRDRFVWGSKTANILYTGGSWQPDRIIRRGVYHRKGPGGIVSFVIVSHLIPFADKAGYMIRYEIKNMGDKPIDINMLPTLNPGKPSLIPLSKWNFNTPPWGSSPAPFGFLEPQKDIEVKQTASNEWQTSDVSLKFFQGENHLIIPPGQQQTGYVAIALAEKGQPLPDKADFAEWESNTQKIWATRLKWALGKIPKISTANKALENYYKRSIASGLVCIWEKPAFKFNPTLVTSGIDGGSMTAYLWDIAGYAPNLVTLMMGDHIKDIARHMAAIDLEKYFAFNLDGSGTGVRYAYSTVAFVTLVKAMACQDKVDRQLFEEAKRLVLRDEERPMVNGVIDYGEQKNLLEMRGLGYEHMVPSPNSERVWCLRQLAALGERIGYNKAEIDQWNKKADTIAANIRTALWDDKAGWFCCRYPDGHKELVYSIQIFDMLRSGVCTPIMKKRIVDQLVENKFLFSYGVSSISKADSLHYEVTDTDWGGGGAYTGDVAQLALDLYRENFPKKAYDVLRRQFWLGEQWPYFPQEHFCDRPASPIFKRSNIIAGLTGAEAILYGMVGFDPRVDGSLWISPQYQFNEPLLITGYRYKKHEFNVLLSRNFMKIIMDGRIMYQGKPKPLKVI
jgi:hypothetical protein